jgi:hypothetical protein
MGRRFGWFERDTSLILLCKAKEVHIEDFENRAPLNPSMTEIIPKAITRRAGSRYGVLSAWGMANAKQSYLIRSSEISA